MGGQIVSDYVDRVQASPFGKLAGAVRGKGMAAQVPAGSASPPGAFGPSWPYGPEERIPVDGPVGVEDFPPVGRGQTPDPTTFGDYLGIYDGNRPADARGPQGRGAKRPRKPEDPPLPQAAVPSSDAAGPVTRDPPLRPQAGAPELLPYQRAFLDTIAIPESGGRYDVRYSPTGAKTFDPSKGHPRIYENGPHGKSSAAGKYQIVYQTYEGKGGGPFGPADQDRMAWRIAVDDYRARTGRSLDADLQTEGFSPRIQRILTPTWQGLGVASNERLSGAYKAALGGKAPSVAAAPSAGTSSGQQSTDPRQSLFTQEPPGLPMPKRPVTPTPTPEPQPTGPQGQPPEEYQSPAAAAVEVKRRVFQQRAMALLQGQTQIAAGMEPADIFEAFRAIGAGEVTTGGSGGKSRQKVRK